MSVEPFAVAIAPTDLITDFTHRISDAHSEQAVPFVVTIPVPLEALWEGTIDDDELAERAGAMMREALSAWRAEYVR